MMKCIKTKWEGNKLITDWTETDMIELERKIDELENEIENIKKIMLDVLECLTKLYFILKKS